jgi:Tetrapyrrole (Corrin/Porphyrin) Methylases
VSERFDRRSRRRGALVVVGTGITGIGQTTLETVACLERADKVFFLVTEPTTELWIRGLNPSAESLAGLYADHKNREQTYAEITRRLVSAVRGGARVCAAFYGHPGVLVQASHRAIRILKRDRFSARMLPGVSADGCLYADLGVNPGDHGVQSFEATDFLLYRRRFDPTSELLLWQVGVLGEPRAIKGVTCRPERLRTLVNVLRRSYPGAHRVTLYYAPMFPSQPPIVMRLRLDRLPQVPVSPLALLYVPALPQREADPKIAAWFDEK